MNKICLKSEQRRICYKNIFFILISFLVCYSTLFLPAGIASASPLPEINSLEKTALQYGKIHLFIIKNEGQFVDDIQYYMKGSSNVFFTTKGVHFQKITRKDDSLNSISIRNPLSAETEDFESDTYYLEFINSGSVDLRARNQLPGTVNYLIGNNPQQWHQSVPTYGELIYPDLFAQNSGSYEASHESTGIDLIFKTVPEGLKYEFVVNNGADPDIIRLGYSGIEDLTIGSTGNLIIRTLYASIVDENPYCYQDIDGKKKDVTCNFQIIEEQVEPEEKGISERPSGKKFVWGFDIGSFNPDYPLVIDPGLVYSTYLGGNDLDDAKGIAIDSLGNAYITGWTYSADFPTTPGSYDTLHNYPWYFGSYTYYSSDAFVVKLDPTGTIPEYSTFIGGSNAFGSTRSKGPSDDGGNSIAVDNVGNVYLTGTTGSLDFPVTSGAYDTTFNSLWYWDDYGVLRAHGDIFICKLDSTGSNLVYSTYIGGYWNDDVNAIAVDSSGNAYITGSTINSDFPTTPGSYDPTHNPGINGQDAYLAKIDSLGSSLLYSTFLGGSNWDSGTGIITDSQGNAYVVGSTGSSEFPTTEGAYDRILSPGDAFITKLNPSGSELVFSTLLGGTGYTYYGNDDNGLAIALDEIGNIYVAGSTVSNTDHDPFPTTADAYDRTYNGGIDGFVSKLNPTATELLYSTFLGGSNIDRCNGIAVDANGDIWVTGETNSYDFPIIPGGFDPSYNGMYDVFATKLSPSSDGLLYSTFVGGSGHDQGRGIAVDQEGNCYIAGYTESTDFPTTAGAFETTPSDSKNGFACKITSTTNSAPIADAGGPYTGFEGTTVTLDGSGSTDPDAGDHIVSYDWDLDGDEQFDDATGMNPVFTWGNDQTVTVVLKVTDSHGASATASSIVKINNVAPTVYAGGAATIDEGSIFSQSGSFTDPGADSWTATVDYGDGSGVQSLTLTGKTFTLSHSYLDDDADDLYTAIVRVADDDGGVGTVSIPITVKNVAPDLGEIVVPLNPQAVGTSIIVSAPFTDSGKDQFIVSWTWDDGSTSAGSSTGSAGSYTATGSHSYSSAGVYTVSVSVADDDGGSDSATPPNYIVIYDPNGGFVTGGGWINSPGGAYRADPLLAGKTTFGFVSKYLKGAKVPTGTTEFQFHVAQMNFHSDRYEWLVISGPRAQYKGTGNINGVGSYRFLLSITDGQVSGGGGTDKFRIKIWDIATGNIAYDNQMGAAEGDAPTLAIAGGSIVIHTK